MATELLIAAQMAKQSPTMEKVLAYSTPSPWSETPLAAELLLITMQMTAKKQATMAVRSVLLIAALRTQYAPMLVRKGFVWKMTVYVETSTCCRAEHAQKKVRFGAKMRAKKVALSAYLTPLREKRGLARKRERRNWKRRLGKLRKRRTSGMQGTYSGDNDDDMIVCVRQELTTLTRAAAHINRIPVRM